MNRFRPIAALALFALSIPTMGNDGAMHDGSRGPEPLESSESLIRMVSEHIEVDFYRGHSTVHCTFHFKNTADHPVKQLLGFPDEGAAIDRARQRGWPLADPTLTPILRMRTEVNGHPVKSKLHIVEVAPGEEGGHFAFWDAHHQHGVSAWYTVELEFPVDREVVVERFYTLENGWSMPGVNYFHYTTETGAAWKGVIGRLQADVTLHNGVTAGQLIWPGTKMRDSIFDAKDSATTSPERRLWTVRDARHLRLVWKNFEPRTELAHRGFTVSCKASPPR